jgi:16S rRNA (uracil1498-N3)-methyltransferase
MNLFYAPDLNSKLYMLNDEESKHCIRVLRLTINDEVQLVDGRGGFYTARIIETKPRCVLQIESSIQEYEKRPFSLHIAMSPLKNADRFEWFVEKAVEMGIDEITPILCKRTERKSINIDRLERIAISAMKQSVKAYKPIINVAIPFDNFIKTSTSGMKLIAHCEESGRAEISSIYKTGSNVIVLIGPEGDFTENEISNALQNNYLPISLGNSRLRTETAGIKACAVLNFLNNC